MGSRVGPYIVTSTLGQGTFGKVKLAQHQETGKEYAIKILDKSDIKANELTVNVRREIAIMKALNHKNIVNLREVLSSKSKLYIVMDLVRGGELFDQIEKKGELEVPAARKYFQQLIDGIDYCHRRGVCHRDLKPENLLVDSNGTLKITDFGVSSMKGVSGSDLLYTACGTPYYCAPEIINGAEEGYSGVKIDAWSCGIILFLLLTGQLPFQNEDMALLYEQINRCKVEYPHWMSPDAKDLISRLLEKDPEKRFSLEDVKKHPWFLVDYEPADSDLHRRTSDSNRAGSHSSASSRGSGKASRGNSRGSKSRERIERGRRSNEPVQPAPAPAPAPEPEPIPVVRDVVAEFEGKELEEVVRAALPGKPQKRIDDVVTKLADLDIDCTEDIQFLAKTFKTPKVLTEWLESNSNLPAVTCMRISGFFFQSE